MDEKVAERLDAWWAGLDEGDRGAVMDRVGTEFQDDSLLEGLTVGEDYTKARWSDGERHWAFHLRAEARAFAEQRADVREFKRMTD